ncbi:DUF397 domain-containing protein [Nocardiopsis sp. RSe5-2]|uniref:DUF397 domain-containing protein n=1 Tax=Nocardiopsis endophytica TaxID=3018445 RepID=A0ABT4U8S9_9ACTN|nr:DUF397 domain-containing protein [Nocardiopsis endophytica]MDA2813126.1 DUF397 domain-containing protein [Nocardiopsis endophytica]
MEDKWRTSSYSSQQGGECVEVALPQPVEPWRKSTYSHGNGGACVEIALPAPTWAKSRYSSAASECVEVARSLEDVKVRDTQNRAAGHLSFSGTEWAAFLAEARSRRL